MKNLLKILSIVLAAAMLITPGHSVMAADYSSYSNTEVNWGLSLRKDHIAPEGTYPKGVKISDYGAFYKGKADKNDPTVYLTFDCGFENGYTDTILDILKKNDIKACFFVTKPFVTKNSKLVKRMKKEGHLVGNHTATHPNLTTKSPDQIKKELTDTAKEMKSLTGYSMDPYMRPPAGQYSVRVLKVIEDTGYKTVFWSLAWYDYNVDDQPSVAYVLERFSTYHHNGLLPLMHNTSSADTAALDDVIKYLKDQGYRFGTIDEIGKKKSKITIGIKKETPYTGEAVEAVIKKTVGDGKVKTIYYDKDSKKLDEAPTEPGTYYVKAKISATEMYAGATSKKKKFKIVKGEGDISVTMNDVSASKFTDPVVEVTEGDYTDFSYTYYDAEGEKLESIPTTPGDYSVSVTAAATEHYAECESEKTEFRVLGAGIFGRAVAWFLRFF